MTCGKRISTFAACLAAVGLVGCDNSAQQAINSPAERKLPAVVNARSLSQHYVEVEFADVVTAVGDAMAALQIMGPNSAELPISDAFVGEGPNLMVLTTGPQEDVPYVLRSRDGSLPVGIVGPSTGLGESGLPDGITFTGLPGSLEPFLVYAISLSNTTVLMNFNLRMDRPTTQNRNFYSIADPDLNILGAVLATDDVSLTLTTTPQVDTLYTVKATSIRSNIFTYGGLYLHPEWNKATFQGIAPNDTVRPKLVRADVLDHETVVLTFSEPLENHAGDLANYSVSPSLSVLGVTLNEWNTQATLKIVPLTTGVVYTVTANTNIEDRSGNLMDPAFKTAMFSIPADETVKPRMVNAAALNATSILLTFSEPLTEAAADAANYSIAPSLVVSAAEQSVHKTQVQLTTLPMTKGTQYTVTASNLFDLATPGNIIDPANNSRSFTFSGAAGLDGGEDDSYLPRVVGAIATTDTFVVVQFSEPMADNAADPLKYSITGPETVFLYVNDAVLSPDATSVRLETSVQADYDYVVHVVGVTDKAGNQLASPDLLSFPTGFDPTRASFRGVVEIEADGVTDTDGDGFADWFENAGWEILVGLANGGVKRAFVTSDPYKPDTDGDGFTDGEENAHNWDPRTNDTDADRIDDPTEFNLWYSDPADQDSDDDGIDDYTEIEFFRTNPAVADSDGDGFGDDREISEMNRNPLVADLPLPQITVSDIALELNITSSYTDEEGMTRSVTDMTSSTFTQSRTNTQGTSDTTSTESENEFGQEVGAEIGSGSGVFGWKISAKASFSQKQARGYSSTVNRESSEMSQQEYQESVTNALETSERRSVTRTIDSAIVQATVNISNNSDLAFSITNLELSLLQQDRLTGLTFVPIAAMRPTGASDPTNQPVFNLGPREAERGPIIFENTTVFPNRIDALMREPTGLVFDVVNFDVTDESGRNLVFTSQDVSDRTVGLTIDFGDGRVEAYRIATVSVFDDFGRQTGISMQRALEIIDITKAIQQESRATPANIASGDVMRIRLGAVTIATATADATPTVAEMCAGLAAAWNASVNPMAQVITATDRMTYVELRADEADVPFIVSSTVTGTGTLTITTHTMVSPDFDHTYKTIQSPRVLPDMTMIDVEALSRIRDVENSADGLKFWVGVSSNTDLDPNADFSNIMLHSHETMLLMYTSDEDEDGLFAREEYLYGSDDTLVDSDGDGLLDYDEVRTGWTVLKVPGLPYKTFPSPARPDSDLDGLEDDVEMAAATDPNRADTDEDGLSDETELLETYMIELFDGDTNLANNLLLSVVPYSDWAIMAGTDGVCDTTIATGGDTTFTLSSDSGSKLCIAPGPNGVIDTAPLDDDQVVAIAKIDAGPNGMCETTVATGDDVQEYITTAAPGTKGTIGKVCISAGLNNVLDTTTVLGDDFVRVAHKAPVPKIGPGPDGECDTLMATGDDVLAFSDASNPPKDPIFGAICVSAGPNNVLNTALGGDDVLLVKRGIFGTDPGNRDTDLDGITDGREELIGINPNRSDAGKVTDTDRDGLFDDEETAGWLVNGMTVTSDKNDPDTDRDGIPDIIERAIASSPRSLDTDGDTLLDYNEFDSSNPSVNGTPLYDTVVLASALQRCVDAPGCTYTPPTDPIGTHPGRADTDMDTRPDNVEINTGWTVTVVGMSPTTVFSNPLASDFDADGLTDIQELNGPDGVATGVDATDPNDADTDGDNGSQGVNGTDGYERMHSRSAVQPDVRVTFAYTRIQVTSNCEGVAGTSGEFYGELYITLPGAGSATTEYDCDNCCQVNDFGDCNISTSEVFTLNQGQSFTASSNSWIEDDGSCGPACAPESVGSFSQAYSYGAVTVGPSTSPLSGPDVCITIHWNITLE